MRYFTPAWLSGDLSDDEYDAVLARYRAHLAAIEPQLPAAVRALATEVNLHDGRIRQVALDRRNRTLRLALRCGDLQAGYFDLELEYQGVLLDRLDVETLRAIALDPTSEALYDEVDVLDEEAFTHAIIFWSEQYRWLDCREVTVAFHGLEIARKPAAVREIRAEQSRFVMR